MNASQGMLNTTHSLALPLLRPITAADVSSDGASIIRRPNKACVRHGTKYRNSVLDTEAGNLCMALPSEGSGVEHLCKHLPAGDGITSMGSPKAESLLLARGSWPAGGMLDIPLPLFKDF